jgi:hypothetical protein
MPTAKFDIIDPTTVRYVQYADGSIAYAGTFDKDGKRVVNLREANGIDLIVQSAEISISFPDFSDSAGASRE